MASLTPILPTIEYPQERIETADQLEELSRQPGIENKIAAIENRYDTTINIESAMRDLDRVGSFLQLAYAGAKGHPCSTSILRITSGYQDLIKESRLTSGSFVSRCLEALRYHQMALTLVERGRLEKATDFISRTGELAKTMSEASEGLVGLSSQLKEDAVQALIATNTEQAHSEQTFNAHQQRIAELQAEEASLTSQTENLSALIDDLKVREDQVRKDAQSTRNSVLAVSIISSVMAPVGVLAEKALQVFSLFPIPKRRVEAGAEEKSEAAIAVESTIASGASVRKSLAEVQKILAIKNKALELEEDLDKKRDLELEIAGIKAEEQSLLSQNEGIQKAQQAIKGALEAQAYAFQEQENAIAKQLASYQKDRITSNASLARAVSQLGSMRVEEGSLEQAVISLDVAVRTLGKIKTVFANTHIFWKNIQKECNRLADLTDIEMVNEPGLEDMFQEAIKESGWAWVALGRMSHKAQCKISAVDSQLDHLMSHLPTRNQASEIVQQLSEQMSRDLQEELEALEAEEAERWS
jgi:hypothetical protein